MRKTIILNIIMCFSFNITGQFINNYDYDNWPGKDGVIKTDVVLPHQLFISQYDMFYRQGSTETHVRYKILYNENDTIKNGYLQLRIYSNIEQAQLDLVEYLDVIQDFPKPPRLINEDFKAGDVAFGKEYDRLLLIAYTRNNVLAIIYAPTEKTKDIALEIDSILISAPEWEKYTSNPIFILTK